MPFADADDVRRMSGITADPPTDETLEMFVETIQEWFTLISGKTFGDEGTAKFFNARLDDLFTIPVKDATITEIRLVSIPALEPFTFTDEGDFQVINGNQVQLWMFAPYIEAITEGIDTWTDRTKFARVEIDWTSEQTVPAPVRDGVALLAASLYRQGRTTTSNLASEKIGDYAYTNVTSTTAARALMRELNPIGYSLLRPYLRRRVVVT